jgi:hypothetical protein
MRARIRSSSTSTSALVTVAGLLAAGELASGLPGAPTEESATSPWLCAVNWAKAAPDAATHHVSAKTKIRHEILILNFRIFIESKPFEIALALLLQKTTAVSRQTAGTYRPDF